MEEEAAKETSEIPGTSKEVSKNAQHQRPKEKSKARNRSAILQQGAGEEQSRYINCHMPFSGNAYRGLVDSSASAQPSPSRPPPLELPLVAHYVQSINCFFVQRALEDRGEREATFPPGWAEANGLSLTAEDAAGAGFVHFPVSGLSTEGEEVSIAAQVGRNM